MVDHLHASATVQLALDTLDFELSPFTTDADSSLIERTFSEVVMWIPGLPLPATHEALLLIPGRLTDAEWATLHDALDGSLADGLHPGGSVISAIVIPRDQAEHVPQTPALHERLLTLDSSADWADTTMLLRSLCVHDHSSAFGTAGLRRGDLFALAQSLATLAGGAVSIVDTAGRIIGYSTLPDQPIDEIRRQSTLTLSEATSPRADEEHQRLNRSPIALWFPPEGDVMGRAALAVRSGNELMGTIWLITQTIEEGQRGCEFLDSIAGLAAHHMFEAREQASADVQRSSDLLRTLLDDDAHRDRAISELGISHTQLYRAVSFTAVSEVTANPVLHSGRQLHHVSLTARSVFSWSQSALLGDQFVCLIPHGSEDLSHTFAQRVIDSSRVELRAGIGSLATGGLKLVNSMREAMAITRLLRAHPAASGPVASIDDVRELLGLTRLLARIEETEVLEHDTAHLLFEYDEKHDSQFAETVLTYLDAFGHIGDTAEILHMHPNTVRYRLERVRDELGIDLSIPHVRLWTWLRLTEQHTSR